MYIAFLLHLDNLYLPFAKPFAFSIPHFMWSFRIRTCPITFHGNNAASTLSDLGLSFISENPSAALYHLITLTRLRIEIILISRCFAAKLHSHALEEMTRFELAYRVDCFYSVDLM